MLYRIGIGYDIHRLVKGRKLFLGGIEIPYLKGSLGHSDADPLIHAICDALLGAAGEGDIGAYFPDTDPKYKGILSLKLLKIVLDSVRDKGFKVKNIDTVIVIEEPKLVPFKKEIQRKIAATLGIKQDCLNIKAKTAEGRDAVGKKQAVAAYAVALLSKGGRK